MPGAQDDRRVMIEFEAVPEQLYRERHHGLHKVLCEQRHKEFGSTGSHNLHRILLECGKGLENLDDREVDLWCVHISERGHEDRDHATSLDDSLAEG